MILGTLLMTTGAWYHRWPPFLLGLVCWAGVAATCDLFWIWDHLWFASLLSFITAYKLRALGADPRLTWAIKAVSLVTMVLFLMEEFG
jgi:hypothetical protein